MGQNKCGFMSWKFCMNLFLTDWWRTFQLWFILFWLYNSLLYSLHTLSKFGGGLWRNTKVMGHWVRLPIFAVCYVRQVWSSSAHRHRQAWLRWVKAVKFVAQSLSLPRQGLRRLEKLATVKYICICTLVLQFWNEWHLRMLATSRALLYVSCKLLKSYTERVPCGDVVYFRGPALVQQSRCRRRCSVGVSHVHCLE